MTSRLVALLCVTCAASGAGQAAAQTPPVQKPVGLTAPVVIPDHFLRRWDPLTIFFPRDLGPAQAGPEDRPDAFVNLSPSHPGAYRWLDPRTLQFRPAEPWPSLARFTVQVDGKSFVLTTLMAAPEKTFPVHEAEGLDPVDQISLTFPQPMDPRALARMASVELRPLPGIGGGDSRWLTQDDFQVKTVERSGRAESATYVLALNEPIALGTRAVVHLRLSLDDEDARSFKQIAFSTAEPFRALGLGCRAQRYPLTPEGTSYSEEQAISCASGERTVLVQFSAPPRALGPVQGRNLVRFTPAVEKLSFTLRAKTLEVTGEFAWDTLYNVRLARAPITDTKGRRLEMGAGSDVYLYFPRKPSYLKWGASQGIVERFGPHRVPLEGRGEERLDLRIHKVPALERSFWPFPDRPVAVDEARRPPGPGEEPTPFTDPGRNITPNELTRQLGNLGTPPVSALVTLPLRREGSAASFGLDLETHLARMAGREAPGTYLVGLRQLGSDTRRSWMRLQVTDLSLSTVEQARAVRFVVTSLSTGQPVPGARVRVEGSLTEGRSTRWVVFTEGTTDSQGAYLWPAPGYDRQRRRTVRRLVVENGADMLVLDATRPPDGYTDNQWSASHETWLQWVFQRLGPRGARAETLAHIFTERPVYRPDEDVHIKGYLRVREQGRLTPERMHGWVVVEGPGDLAWKYPVQPTAAGSFYHKFSEASVPTGIYRAHFENKQRTARYGRVTFRKEAYRIPRFEVALHAPDRVPLDREFDVSLTASYYAGGRVSGQPVQWRVTQFPSAWTPKAREGFRYSSDTRFSRQQRFVSTPRLEKTDTTDDAGSASLTLNPAVEPTAQPRSYVVEATVTGADDQTVTTTRRIRALPPFVLGLKAPRYLERAEIIPVEVIVVSPEGELMPGTDVTVRLMRREWHSHLRASDFSDGVARYVTDVVEKKISQTMVKSGAQPLALKLDVPRSGVYVVELEAHDRLERAQVVRVDLFAGGDEPVAWSRPTTRVFSVATDRPRYDPGSTAVIVLKSPFQNARALAIVEGPDENRYQWVDVRGGTAVFRLPVENHFVPRVPVHFVLMRGRVPGTAPRPGNSTDLGKPATLASTAWVRVNPVGNRVDVALDYPKRALPGRQVDVTIKLTDPAGRPLSGEVTLWLVDQAVLALGQEQRLDPLPDFISAVRSHLSLRDTRNRVFGSLPFADKPGGDEGAEEESDLLDRVTVRKNFQPVPYFNPAILVGPAGSATVKVQLPDNLTNFKLRAKAASGPGRFGFATGQIAVRLPVIVQPALPRFVRPGDRFVAAAVGRIVEGKGGPGAVQVRAEGVLLEGPTRREFTWIADRPERLAFPVQVETPSYTAEGRPERAEVTFRVAVERLSDQAADAFEVRLPLREDRRPIIRRALEQLAPGSPVALPAVEEPVRSGTLRRSVLVSGEPALVRMAAGLDFFLDYPYGCTEQRLSRARTYLALKKFRALLHQRGAEEQVRRAVQDVLDWIPTALDDQGRVAYWPGGSGYVSLTAWVVQFLVEAREAGFKPHDDDKLMGRLMRTLEQALRSDYGHFIDGLAFTERAWALAALAQAGRFNAAYAAELARKAQFLNLEGTAQVLQAFARGGESSSTVETLTDSLWEGVIVRLHQGREIYGGLQEPSSAISGLILPSETRTLAEVTRAVAKLQPENPRLPVLVDALVTLGRGDGWGSTNANASALLALSELVTPPFSAMPSSQVQVTLDGDQQTLDLGPAAPAAYVTGTGAQAGSVELLGDAGGRGVVMRAETRYLPVADGSQVQARSTGFVVSREVLRLVHEDQPLEKRPIEAAGTTLSFSVGDVIEDHVQVVNPKSRHYVAVVVPLAAGLEPLNPHLATAPPEARPKGTLTRPPTYVAFLDDHVAFYYDSLPAGTYDFFFRTRATTPGTFIQPAALAEMMYDGAVTGNSPGARVVVEAQAP